jgi:hypothetical protein
VTPDGSFSVTGSHGRARATPDDSSVTGSRGSAWATPMAPPWLVATAALAPIFAAATATVFTRHPVDGGKSAMGPWI